jgi:hypothetical protein
MNEELAERYAEALHEILGYPGRMISYSKSGYHEAHPERAAIFNASVCVTDGTLWWGDLDLSLDEAKLAELSKQIDEIVYVLYEADGRFENEQRPLLGKAVYSVTPTGHTRYRHEYIERASDGSLQMRPREPDTRPRWRWRVLSHRPRLLRFWIVDRRTTTDRNLSERSTLVYVGARDRGATPLLVLVCFHAHRIRTLGVDVTFYPSKQPARHAPRPLVSVRPTVRLRRLGLWLVIVAWPGFMWELRAGWEVRPRWTSEQL